MSASGRVEGPTTHTLESEEIPQPMPSSWRPYGSGLPIAARKISSHSARSRGRSFALNTIALLVPPRMNVAGIFSCLMSWLLWLYFKALRDELADAPQAGRIQRFE